MSFNTVRLDEEDQRRQNIVIRQLSDGKSNNTGTVTLTINSATTVVSDFRAGADSVITFMPTTANAAAELATMYVSSQGKQTFTLTHANNALNDRTFGVTITG